MIQYEQNLVKENVSQGQLLQVNYFARDNLRDPKNYEPSPTFKSLLSYGRTLCNRIAASIADANKNIRQALDEKLVHHDLGGPTQIKMALVYKMIELLGDFILLPERDLQPQYKHLSTHIEQIH